MREAQEAMPPYSWSALAKERSLSVLVPLQTDDGDDGRAGDEPTWDDEDALAPPLPPPPPPGLAPRAWMRLGTTPAALAEVRAAPPCSRPLDGGACDRAPTRGLFLQDFGSRARATLEAAPGPCHCGRSALSTNGE